MGAALRRGGRVAEGARLESVYTGNRIVGSNPTPSATVMSTQKYSKHQYVMEETPRASGTSFRYRSRHPTALHKELKPAVVKLSCGNSQWLAETSATFGLLMTVLTRLGRNEAFER